MECQCVQVLLLLLVLNHYSTAQALVRDQAAP
jgi:hypothetical protein